MGRLRAFACGMSLAVAGCSLLTSLDGLSSGGDATPVAEGGTDAPIDASSAPETSATDSAPAKGFCESQSPAPTICEDFDVGDPRSRWNEVTRSGGTTQLVDAPVRSGSHAYGFAVPSGNTTRSGFLQRSLPELVTHARLSYSLWVEQRPTGEYEVSLLRFREPNGGPQHDYYLAVQSSRALFVEQRDTPEGNLQLPFSGVIPSKKWTRVSIEVFLAPPARAIVKLDDVEVTNAPSFLGAPGIPDVNVGITYSGNGQGSGSIFIDDVTFEILP